MPVLWLISCLASILICADAFIHINKFIFSGRKELIRIHATSQAPRIDESSQRTLDRNVSIAQDDLCSPLQL